MNQETKDKIKAMLPLPNDKDGILKKREAWGWVYLKREGATPWAEWCQRLGKELNFALENDFNFCKKEDVEKCYNTLEEYQDWLNKGSDS